MIMTESTHNQANQIIEDKCTCGEPILVEVNTKRGSRTDGKRPHYHDSALPDGIDLTKYSAADITVLRCRRCGESVGETVPAAAYDKGGRVRV